MKRATWPLLGLTVLVATGGGCASDSPNGRTYDNNDLELVVANGAFMMCTCTFVMQMNNEYCAAWVKASPNVARVSVDPKAKTARASAFIAWTATARYVDDKRGCVVE